MSKVQKFALCLIGSIALAPGVLSLSAGSASGTTPSGSGAIAEAPDSGYDLFAVVASDGTLVRGSAQTQVQHKPGTGQYNVVFESPIVGCAATANLGYPGDHEEFTFQSAVTVGRTGDPHVIAVDVTYPGDTTAGHYPHHPVLRDNAFHLHVQCGDTSGVYAVVNGFGSVILGTPGVTASRIDVGTFAVTFPRDISTCAPVATVRNPRNRSPRAIQAYLALGSSNSTIRVSINRGRLPLADVAFELSVTCTGSYAVFSQSSGFYNPFTVPGAQNCAFTGSWYNPVAGSQPSNQGYVSTWYTDATTAGIQTKNGGYGIQGGYPVDVVATC